MRQTSPERVQLETDTPLTAESAQEIKDAWLAWQVVARRYGVRIRVVPDRWVFSLPDIEPSEVS